MMDKKISVILPVYNAEKYLYQCIESIITQTYRNIEIIIVDDGSTDNSSEICKEMQILDRRIIYFRNDNHGVGYTRNYGLRKATGEYIVFVDSDDFCLPNLLELLEKRCDSTNVDLVVSGVKIFYGDINNILKTELVENKVLEKDDYLKDVLLNIKTGYVCGAPYAKLFKRSTIINNSIMFHEELKYGEDFCFNIEYLKCAKTIALLEEANYLYRGNTPNSLTYYNNRNRNVADFWMQRKIVYTIFESAFDDYVNDKKIMSRVHSLLMDYVISTVKLASKEQDRKVLEELINNDFVYKRISYQDATVFKKIRVYLISKKRFDFLLLVERIRYFFIDIIR